MVRTSVAVLDVEVNLSDNQWMWTFLTPQSADYWLSSSVLGPHYQLLTVSPYSGGLAPYRPACRSDVQSRDPLSRTAGPTACPGLGCPGYPACMIATYTAFLWFPLVVWSGGYMVVALWVDTSGGQ